MGKNLENFFKLVGYKRSGWRNKAKKLTEPEEPITEQLKSRTFYGMFRSFVVTCGANFYMSYEDYCEVVDGQKQKGLTKYGQTIDDCPNEAFDWGTMAAEEFVDLMAYLLKSKQND